jgi:dihydroorotase
MNASVIGKNVTIKIPIDTLVIAFDNNPNIYDEAIKVKFKRKFAEGFASYINEFSTNSESGLTVFQECVDEIFEGMIEGIEPYIVYPEED